MAPPDSSPHEPFAFGRRLQVETTFNVLKRHLGSALHSKSHWGQRRNTALVGFAYNILIQSARAESIPTESFMILRLPLALWV